MTALKKTAWKLAGYSLFAFYLVGDLYIWDGFLSQRFIKYSQPLKATDETPTDCIVYGEPITKKQLLTRCKQLNLIMGKGSWESLSPLQQKNIRVKARLELIDEATLRLKTRANDLRLANQTALAKEQIQGLISRVEAPQFWNQLLKSQNSSTKLITDKLNARLKQKAMIEFSIEQALLVDDQELQKYYNKFKDQLTIPAHRQVSHLFLASLNQDPQEVKAKAESIYTRLQTGEDFTQLTKQFSEDKANANNGGKLDIIYQNTRPALDVDLFTLPTDKACLRQSKLGWHIFLASAIIPARQLSFDEIKDSMGTALKSLQQQTATQLFIQSLRHEAHQKKRIIVSDPN